MCTTQTHNPTKLTFLLPCLSFFCVIQLIRKRKHEKAKTEQKVTIVK